MNKHSRALFMRSRFLVRLFKEEIRIEPNLLIQVDLMVVHMSMRVLLEDILSVKFLILWASEK